MIDRSNARRTIKYHNIRVTIISLTPDSASQQYNGDIFDFNDPFKHGNTMPTESSSVPINLTRIIYTSDASPGTCSFTIPDPRVSMYNNPYEDWTEEDINNIVIPKIGDGIIIWAKPDDNTSVTGYSRSDSGDDNNSSSSSFSVVFKGYISGISRHIGEKGSEYSFEAQDLKCRLQDQVIRKTYNNNYKVGSFPNRKEAKKSSEVDNPYANDKWTVKEILEDIMDYSTKTSFEKEWNFTYFDFGDFDFNGNTELRDFIPQTLVFDNISILEAIYRLISSAGSYRMVYDPERDKIWFTKLSSSAKNCGEKIALHYYVPESHSMSNEKYFFDVNVVADNTNRRTNELSNVFKAYSANIEWYSGHFYIVMGRTAIGYVAADSKYYFPAKNWDGYNYYFDLNSVPWNSKIDNLEKPFEVVGCPLYPVWDVRGGYDAYKDKSPIGVMEFWRNENNELVNKEKHDEKVSGGYIKLASGDKGYVEENQGFTINDRKYIKDRNFLDAVGASSFDSATGFSYEAWMPYGVCPYCAGTGAVADNTLTWDKFGQTRNLNGTENTSNKPTGLTPFNFQYESKDAVYKGRTGEETELVPKKHPVPWKNMCPVCRGTGMEPWFKMTTILNNLVDVTPDKARLNELEDSISSKTKDKTWAEVVQDKSYRYPTSVQVEVATSHAAYKRPTKQEGDTPEENDKFIPHSLIGTKSLINNKYSIFRLADDGSGKPVNRMDGYIETLYYTSIMNATGFSIDADRGLIVFKDRQFIECKKPMFNIMRARFNNVFVFCVEQNIDQSKFKDCVAYRGRGEMGGMGQRVKGFWRPSRAWITCYFNRDMFETYLAKQTSVGSGFLGGFDVKGYFNNSSEYELEKEIDGEDGSSIYTISARIEDNRYCAEIKKKSETGDIIEEFTSRPIAKGMSFDSFKWQVHPWDMGRWNVPASNEDGIKMKVPTDYEDVWDTIYKTSKARKYIFPSGKFHTVERIRENEARAIDKEGADLSEVLRSDMRGKLIAWTHKDDRIKLLERGTAELERRNDIQVSGSLVIRGEIPSFKGGFGWVVLQDGVKAVVVKEELNFSNGFTVSLELGTEELRVGQPREKELDYSRYLNDNLAKLHTDREFSRGGTIGGQDGEGKTVNQIGPVGVEV